MSKHCIGIDLGGTFIKFAMLDEHLRAGRISQLPTPLDEGSAGMVAQMVRGAGELIARSGVAASDILGVGIGSPGPLKISEGIIRALPNIPGMQNVPIRDLVAAGLHMPAVLENDANAAAFGEYLCGAGRGLGDMTLLTLGTGIGGGIIIDGKVLHGAHEIAAEIGHVIVRPGGEKCGCGQLGCLERYCSATYLAKWAQRLVEQDAEPTVLRDVLARKGTLDSKDVSDACNAGDALAARVWDEAMGYLALGCINICRILDPDAIVLVGGLTKAGEDLLGPVKAHFKRMTWSITGELTQIKIGSLGNDAGAIGAAGVAWAALGKK